MIFPTCHDTSKYDAKSHFAITPQYRLWSFEILKFCYFNLSYQITAQNTFSKDCCSLSLFKEKRTNFCQFPNIPPIYCKVASTNTSRFKPDSGIHRLLMKEKLDFLCTVVFMRNVNFVISNTH